MNRPGASRNELALTLFFFSLTTLLTLAAVSACVHDSFFRSMIALARQSDLLAQRYFGEVAADQIFADAWRGMQQAIPFRVELADEAALLEPTRSRQDWGLTLSPSDSSLRVMAIAEKSPLKGSLRPADEILFVDDVSAGLLARFSDYLNDRESTLVTLRILRNDRPESLQVVVPTIGSSSSIHIDSLESILSIELRRLTLDVVGELTSALEKTGVAAGTALIVDLRGLHSSSYSAVGLIREHLQRIAADGRSIVLIDGQTTGAAEELALQLREEMGALLLGRPTAGIDSRFEEIRLRSGRRLLVSIDERIEPTPISENASAMEMDSLAGSLPAPGAVLPDHECREPRLSALTFELIHRGLVLDFVTSRIDLSLPAVAQEDRVFLEFREFLHHRGFRFDPLGEALADLSVHEMTPEMRPVYRRLRETRAGLDELHLADYRDEIMRQLLETWHRVHIGGEPTLAQRSRFDDHCLAEALAMLRNRL